MKQHLAKTEKPTLHKLWVFKPQSKPWWVAKDGRQRGGKSRLRLPGGGGGSPCSPLSPDGSPAPPASQASQQTQGWGRAHCWKPPWQRSLLPPEKPGLSVWLCLPETAGWGLGLSARRLGIPSPQQISRLYVGAQDGLAASCPSS